MSSSLSPLGVVSSSAYSSPVETGLPAAAGSADDRVANLFRNAPSSQPQGPLQVENEVVSLSNLWGSPFDIFMAGLWGLLWVSSGNGVAVSGAHLYRLLNAHPDAEPNLEEKQWKELKEFLLSGIGLVGLTANIVDWANQGKMIALGVASAAVKMVGYGASCITSGMRAYKSYKEILDLMEQFKRAGTDAERVYLQQKQLLSGLDLAAYGATAIWALLGFSSLALGVAVPAALMTPLLGFGCILAVSAIFYRVHLSNLYPKAPFGAAQGLAV